MVEPYELRLRPDRACRAERFDLFRGVSCGLVVAEECFRDGPRLERPQTLAVDRLEQRPHGHTAGESR